MKEESGTEIRKLDAAAFKTNVAASKIRELNAATSILDTVACKGRQRSRRLNAEASKMDAEALVLR